MKPNIFFPPPPPLQQLKQAVEKRNEIIAKLSSKLQEAQASRDEVQLEVQSLTGKVQDLQKQLQQVYLMYNFCRIDQECYRAGSIDVTSIAIHSDIELSPKPNATYPKVCQLRHA